MIARRAEDFDGKNEAKLIALPCSERPKGRVHWMLRLLEEKVDRAEDCRQGQRQHDRTSSKKTFSNPTSRSETARRTNKMVIASIISYRLEHAGSLGPNLATFLRPRLSRRDPSPCPLAGERPARRICSTREQVRDIDMCVTSTCKGRISQRLSERVACASNSQDSDRTTATAPCSRP
jgi:hypothetical protein